MHPVRFIFRSCCAVDCCFPELRVPREPCARSFCSLSLSLSLCAIESIFLQWIQLCAQVCLCILSIAFAFSIYYYYYSVERVSWLHGNQIERHWVKTRNTTSRRRWRRKKQQRQQQHKTQSIHKRNCRCTIVTILSIMRNTRTRAQTKQTKWRTCLCFISWLNTFFRFAAVVHDFIMPGARRQTRTRTHTTHGNDTIYNERIPSIFNGIGAGWSLRTHSKCYGCNFDGKTKDNLAVLNTRQWINARRAEPNEIKEVARMSTFTLHNSQSLLPTTPAASFHPLRTMELIFILCFIDWPGSKSATFFLSPFHLVLCSCVPFVFVSFSTFFYVRRRPLKIIIIIWSQL